MEFSTLIDGLLAHEASALLKQTEVDEILTRREGLLQFVFESRRIPAGAKDAWKEAVWRACHRGMAVTKVNPDGTVDRDKPDWRPEREQLANLRVFSEKLGLSLEDLHQLAARRRDFLADWEARKQRNEALTREAEGYIERVGGTLATDPEGCSNGRVLNRVRKLQGIA